MVCPATSPRRAFSNTARAIATLSMVLIAAFTSAPSIRGETLVLVATGSAWRYLDNGSDPGTAWRAATFNDGAWASGAAQLGYGDGDEATVVGYGGNSAAKYITTYFRRTFSVSNPSQFSTLTLRLLRDDGAMVYVNGVEVFRSNMPAGAIGYTTPALTAITGADESAFVFTSIDPSLLVAGTNVIAVEIHQSDPTSSDISFDLELTGGSSLVLTRGPYLQLATPTGIAVRWRTSAAVIGRVQFGPSPGVVSGSAQETSARVDHEVRLTDLTPDTLYYYSVGTASQVMAGDSTFHFQTPPVPGTVRATRVWVIGDSGTADANAQAVRNAYSAYTGTRETDVWLMLGDNAYSDGLDAEYQAAVFNTYPEMLRKTVLWPAYGNHDGYSSDAATNAGPYFDIFTLPKQAEAGGVASGNEAYYSFDYANIHFVCLESFETDRSPTGPMLTWLQRDLAANTQPWLIAYFHHPPYSKGSHDSDVDMELIEMRQNAVPILETFGVDLVLSGHSHSYERSFLIDGHYGTSTTFTDAMKKNGGSGRADQSGAYTKPSAGMAPHEGAVYLVAGVAGKTEAGTLNHPAMYLSQTTLGSVVLDVNDSRLDATFIDSVGSRRDYFSIVKGSSPGTGPFGGTPAAVPGTIQAENFDEGGQNVAYYDTNAGNKGGMYRATDVDIQATTDTGGGYSLGWTKAGEWLKYTVGVAAAGTYTLQSRIANVGVGSFHVEVDGVDRTGAITVPNTGAWDAWQTISTPGIALTAGSHVLRVVLDTMGSGGAVGGFNWFRFVAEAAPPPPPPPGSTPYGGTPWAVPGLFEAENFDEGGQNVAYYDTAGGNKGGVYRATDVDLQPTTDAGGGYSVGWTKAGEWLQYTVNVGTAGSYVLEARIANIGIGSFHVEIDGVNRTGSVTVPDTGAWDAWQTIRTAAMSLTTGQHKVCVVFDTVGSGGAVGGFNWFRFVTP